ncbi:MAG: hypothetical protein ABSC77_12720 [Terracidiphilus sp.]
MAPDNPHCIKPKHSQRKERIRRRKRNEFDSDECFDEERGNDGDEDAPARRNPKGQQAKGQRYKNKDAEQIRAEEGDLLPKIHHRWSAKARGNVHQRMTMNHRGKFFDENTGGRRQQRQEDDTELILSEPIRESAHINSPLPPCGSPAAFPEAA